MVLQQMGVSVALLAPYCHKRSQGSLKPMTFGVWGPCHHHSHPDLSGLVLLPGVRSQEPGCCPEPSCCSGRVWVCGPAASGVYVDVCGPCHLRGPEEPCMPKSEGHTETSVYFPGSGKDGPAPHWILQQETCPPYPTLRRDGNF